MLIIYNPNPTPPNTPWPTPIQNWFLLHCEASILGQICLMLFIRLLVHRLYNRSTSPEWLPHRSALQCSLAILMVSSDWWGLKFLLFLILINTSVCILSCSHPTIGRSFHSYIGRQIKGSSKLLSQNSTTLFDSWRWLLLGLVPSAIASPIQ